MSLIDTDILHALICPVFMCRARQYCLSGLWRAL